MGSRNGIATGFSKIFKELYPTLIDNNAMNVNSEHENKNKCLELRDISGLHIFKITVM